jgi:hypothetical protein
MSIPYDTFYGAFLSKISEFELLGIDDNIRTEIIDGYMKRAISAFKKNCKYDLFTTGDDTAREFVVDVAGDDLDELVEIISEGMVVQWLKPYVYQQELLQNVLNTRDFTQYSPAELLMRVGNAYEKAQKDYTQMIREYSYNHGDLTDLHL